MEEKSLANKIIGIIVALFIYAGGVFVGVGVFSLMNGQNIFHETGFVQIYLYLAISLLASLLTIALLSISFRNLSLLKMFPSLIGPISYIGLVFYFQIYDYSTIVALVMMCIYALYVFLRGVIAMEDISTPDNKVFFLKEKHPNSYILIYIGGGILPTSILAFFAFIPLIYHLQCSFMALSGNGFPYGDNLAIYIISWGLMGIGIIYSIIVDVPLFFNKLKKGNYRLYRGGLWGKMKHPNIYGDMLFHLGVALYVFFFTNMYAFILFPLALYLYVFLVIHPYCQKADSHFIDGYGKKEK